MALSHFDPEPRIVDALFHALRNDPDADADVQDSALFSLDQFGLWEE